MLLYSDKLTRGDLDMIAGKMPVTLFDTDPDFHGERRRRIKVLIRPTAMGTDGDRWRKVRQDPYTGGERRIFAVSWHGHYVFMAACLELDPRAEFKTALAHWKGREDFHDRAPSTANLNWGSMMYPEYAGQMAHYTPDVGEMRRIACGIAGTTVECPNCGGPEGYPSGHAVGCPNRDRDISFGELSPAGYTQVGTLQQSTIMACPHVIIDFAHYRADGSCKCNDPGENIMADWGYTWDEALGRWN